MNRCPFDIHLIKQRLNDCPDIIQRTVYIDGKYEAFFFYISNHIDKDLIQRDFMRVILSKRLDELTDSWTIQNLPCSELVLVYGLDEVLSEILSGAAVFVSSSMPYAVSYRNANAEKRSIEEPITEKNVRGPHEGFIESLDSNLSILRRKMQSDKLKFKSITLGDLTNQKVVIAYIEDLANIDLVQGLYDKISTIKIDGLPSIGYIEQSIASRPNSIFPEFLPTERPDKAVAALLSGRIVIMLGGDSVVLIAPVTFISFFQAPDDYGALWIHGTFLRLIRIIGAMFVAVLLPSFYIAITSFHYQAVPLTLLVTLAETRSKVPFPPIMEVLILEITVEMVREAAVRLPTYIGTAVSIMAGLIIGQAAVEAGIVSGLVIVIVGATAIATYVIPSTDMALAIRVLRFIFVISSAVFGIVGIVVCTSFAIAHLIALDSLGQPYFAPFSPSSSGDWKDTIFRLPLNKLKKRPAAPRVQKETRGGTNGRK